MIDELIALLKEFKKCFAWSNQVMLGLDTTTVVNRRIKSETILKIKEEVEKQLHAGFLTAIVRISILKS